ncbi:monosaccharide ABC transporter substrate-binding protein, CUT2 family [Arboricoccus pini]|uniref:Monosaccharide ABC transporter substrate-binding protein, CUT2 family n=1 Tax=Arboricoccus pini TaxID=1963835 RepID=A0A212RYR0_9PROT|nr:substrate-binding domain-containing protein [Arboricoccus pini]SNB77850.1 monosaccharide ABC transporter substrate-binding protein, CUT2 family [Arboricoccus pini]
MTYFSKTKTLLMSAALALIAASAQAEGIGVSLLTQQHPFYNELAKAITAEAKAQNVSAEISIANQDLNKQLADIEDFVVKGVDVIIMSPVDSKGALAAVARAQAANIKVITVDVPVEGAKVASYIGTDNFVGGEKAGELMAEQLGGKGNIGIIDYPLVQSVVNRVNGFKAAIAKHPDMKIVSIQTGITRAEALAVAQNMLQANPDINGIFGFGDDAALAASVAVKSSGLSGKVKVIGFDGMPEARAAVDNDPDMVGVIQQYPDQMGKLAIDTAIKLEKGESVPESQPIVPGVYTKKN